MDRKYKIIKKGFFLLMAGVSMGLFTTACSTNSDDEPEAINEGSETTENVEATTETVGGLDCSLTLKNEQGKETATFKEGENIVFSFTVKNTKTTGPAKLYVSNELFAVFNTDSMHRPQPVYNGFTTEAGPTAFTVYTEDGKCMGSPIGAIIWKKRQIYGGETQTFECPWKMIGGRELYSDLFSKTFNNAQLPPGRYYTTMVAKDVKDGEAVLMPFKTYFTVEPDAWTAPTSEAASRLVGKWKLIYQGAQFGEYDTYLEFYTDGSMKRFSKTGNEGAAESYYEIRNDWAYANGSLSGHINCPLLNFDNYSPLYHAYCRLSNSSKDDELYIGTDCIDHNFFIDPGSVYVRVE